jgi:5-methylcytosine-specific restriction enzyme subunit McrC
MKPKLVTIFEHDYIVRDSGKLSDTDFNKLYSYVCNENQKAENNNSVDTWLLKPCFYSGKQALKATQYIGIIQFDDGVVLEILPKLFKTKQDSPQEQIPEKQSRELVLKMLRTLKTANFKNIHSAGLDFAKIHLLDIFIWMFLDEVDSIVKQGIKHKYIEREENLNFFKGKLLVSQNIAKNYGLKHKNYMQYDDYLPNIPENRLIKSALGYLLKTCKSSHLLKEIRKSYFIFDEVSNSLNIQLDYTLCNKNSRIFSHYQNALEWAMVFLAGNSFTTQAGSHNVKSLLFDMNKLFESYVGDYLLKHPDYHSVKFQDSQHYMLYSGSNKLYKLKPDFKFKHKDQLDKFIIADAKWKYITQEKNLSQADLYQMFAYHHKYDKAEVWLIYPLHDCVAKDIKNKQFSFDGNQVNLCIKFFDLDNNNFVEIS